jgi:hypothetical protein
VARPARAGIVFVASVGQNDDRAPALHALQLLQRIPQRVANGTA